MGPTLRGCLGPDRERSTAARFMIRASIESVPPIRRIKNREIDHLRKFAAAMRRSLPDRSEVDLYWGLHFALAMAHQTIRDSERLMKLSDGTCDLNDVAGDHRPHRRGVGDGADGGRGGKEAARQTGGARRALIAAYHKSTLLAVACSMSAMPGQRPGSAAQRNDALRQEATSHALRTAIRKLVLLMAAISSPDAQARSLQSPPPPSLCRPHHAAYNCINQIRLNSNVG